MRNQPLVSYIKYKKTNNKTVKTTKTKRDRIQTCSRIERVFARLVAFLLRLIRNGAGYRLRNCGLCDDFHLVELKYDSLLQPKADVDP